MITTCRNRSMGIRKWQSPLFFLIILLSTMSSSAFELMVQDEQGNPVNHFRWQVEEDTTNYSIAGAAVSDSIGVDIHRSNAPVVVNGMEMGSSVMVSVDTSKRYFVSVLPFADYALGGAPVAPDQQSVTVTVNSYPIPTAQISVLVFEDNNPINNEYDDPEVGLQGFSITISDIAGQVMVDVFGNMLGTTYLQNPDGSFVLDAEGMPVIDVPGMGNILSDLNGEALIKNIAPGKYGVQVIPPAGMNWKQTSTIEGTHTIDAWVKANEPAFFTEGFGTSFKHVAFGFIQPDSLLWSQTPPSGTSELTGQVVYNHFSKPPYIQGYFPGQPVPSAWVGLNDLNADQKGLIAVACDEEGHFTMQNVPPGSYQLVTWDDPLDSIFGFHTVTVPEGGGAVDLGQILTFAWYGKLQGHVFLDGNENGFRDMDEGGIANQAVNLRFRDGTIYQATSTDLKGYYEFIEVFPFFKWLITEVDFAHLKATGVTIAVDDGGQIQPGSGWDYPSFDILNPQVQLEINVNTGNNLSRTETGPVLTEAMQLYLGQANVIDWGKTSYSSGENGGISGIVFYATTRAEDDPRYAVGEEWEPGIPRVQVNLYQDYDRDGVIDDLDLNGVELADVDNYPFGWADGSSSMGPEDVDRNYPGQTPGQFDAGDALNIVTTDSWDDSFPSDCIQTPPIVHGQPVPECFDNFGTWNQVRPGVFDGGYAFMSYFPGGVDSGNPELEGLPNGYYIVEAVTPPGYQVVKEEDRNVDFGDTSYPRTLPPVCAGDPHLVPEELSLFPGIPAAYAGTYRNLCDKKQIRVADGLNAASDFFLFTEVPKAARAVGFINNDLSAEFNQSSPIYGEKAAPSWLPISFQDFNGNEVTRVYTDEFGAYNALLPSTFTVNVPSPSGVSPAMYNICLNHPYMDDPLNPGTKILDPWFDPSYSQACWTAQFFPGTTTYLDTPIVPIASFAGAVTGQVDVEPSSETPLIASVTGPLGVPLACNPGELITITAVGLKLVPNPDYSMGSDTVDRMILRDYSFGSVPGTVEVGNQIIDPSLVTWAADGTTITFTVPADLQTGQVMVTRGDNNQRSLYSVTLHVQPCDQTVHIVMEGELIQDAIDGATSCDLILVGPGFYDENIIMWKDVKLQGSGAAVTIINGHPSPAEKIDAWNLKLNFLITENLIPEPLALNAKETPGIMVIANEGVFTDTCGSLIDGFTFTGSLSGGGMYIDSNINYLKISNNTVTGNQGNFGGGITIGTPEILSNNNHLDLIYNHIAKNGGIVGGGGVSIYSGANDYRLEHNTISGNFSRWNGAGIAHYGLSDNGLIAHNTISFNEIFYGGAIGGDGAGIYISGLEDIFEPLGTGDGSGSVKILSNTIQGNLAGSGNGGGIRAEMVNGDDIFLWPDNPESWFQLLISNNKITNNVAAEFGGGIVLQDVANGFIINNSISNNDSTGTAADSFVAGELNSTPQGAGIVAEAHSPFLEAETGQTYSNPVLEDNIITQNRSFFWDSTENAGSGGIVPNPVNPVWDLQVIRTVVQSYLSPEYCILTDMTGYSSSNTEADPGYKDPIHNSLVSAAVIDEGGNSISVRYSPLTLEQSDYHLLSTSAAIDNGGGFYLGIFPELLLDIDAESRPNCLFVDAGADEYYSITPEADLSLDMTLQSPTQSTLAKSVLYAYSITVTNNGEDCAHGVKVIDTIPQQSLSVDASTTKGTVSYGKDKVFVNIGSLLYQENVTITVTVRLPMATNATNSAMVIAKSPVDPDFSNNTDQISTLPANFQEFSSNRSRGM